MTKHIYIIIFLISTYIIFPRTIYQSDNNNSKKDFVFVLHGLAGSSLTITPLANDIEDAGFDVKIIDYKTLRTSPKNIMQEVSEKIRSNLPDDNRTVHFVGYSLGSIVIRAFLDSNSIPNLGKVVLIAPPNKGSPIADLVKNTWIIDLLGETIQFLGTDSTSFPNSIGDPYYPVGIIAGIGASSFNDFFLPGIDDGIVPFESTKLNNVTDMIVLDESHIWMKFKEKISKQAIEFLRNGRFKK